METRLEEQLGGRTEARSHPVGLVKDKPMLLSHCVCRDHHGADHVHHHHGCERLHAPRVLHQGRGHLPLGQLRVRVPLGAGVRGRQLPDHRAGEERAEAAGEGDFTMSWSVCPGMGAWTSSGPWPGPTSSVKWDSDTPSSTYFMGWCEEQTKTV